MGPRDWTYILLANLSFEENPSRGDGYLSFLIYYFFKIMYVSASSVSLSLSWSHSRKGRTAPMILFRGGL